MRSAAELFRHELVSASDDSQWAGNKCQVPFLQNTRRAAPREKVPDTYFPHDPYSILDSVYSAQGNSPCKTSCIRSNVVLTSAFCRAKNTVAATLVACSLFGNATAAPPLDEPVVARVEMKLAVDEKVVDVIEKGDLLTVLEERDDSYVILTHDGSKGAVEKVNAVRIAESGDIYTDLIERNPGEGRYYTLRASAWWALGNAEKALEDFDKAIELGYKEAHAYTSRGLFHAEIGNFDEALADYNEAIKIDPEDLAPVINRAAVYMSAGEYMKAAEDYTTVLEQRKDSSSLLHQRAIALKAAGKLEEAAADFTTILRDHPDDLTAIMGLGYV